MCLFRKKNISDEKYPICLYAFYHIELESERHKKNFKTFLSFCCLLYLLYINLLFIIEIDNLKKYSYKGICFDFSSCYRMGFFLTQEILMLFSISQVKDPFKISQFVSYRKVLTHFSYYKYLGLWWLMDVLNFWVFQWIVIFERVYSFFNNQRDFCTPDYILYLFFCEHIVSLILIVNMGIKNPTQALLLKK